MKKCSMPSLWRCSSHANLYSMWLALPLMTWGFISLTRRNCSAAKCTWQRLHYTDHACCRTAGCCRITQNQHVYCMTKEHSTDKRLSSMQSWFNSTHYAAPNCCRSSLNLTPLGRQDLPCAYLAHHEPESVNIAVPLTVQLCPLTPCALCFQVGHSDKQAEQKACNNSRACVSAFPTQVQQGLVWVWADCSPQAYIESAMQGPALSPEYGRFEGKGTNPICLTCPTSCLHATCTSMFRAGCCLVMFVLVLAFCFPVQKWAHGIARCLCHTKLHC